MKVKASVQNLEAGFRRELSARPLLAAALDERIERGALIALCGEPGLGKEDALEQARSIAKRRGGHIRTIDLSGLSPDGACERLMRESRSLQRRIGDDAWAIVCLSGVPALDERCVFRMISIVNRFRNKGHCVAISLRPEAVQLIEPCVDAFVVWAHDLCVEPPKSFGSHARDEMQELTAGLPFLTKTLGVSVRDDSFEIHTGRNYHDSLSRLVGLSLRDTLMNEERRLRLAMLLLGSGTFGQLEEVLGRIDVELLQDICRHAPFFGVDLGQSRFSCAGLSRDSWFASCILDLREACVSNPQICSNVTRILLSQGRIERAGSLLAMSNETEESAALVLRNALELINVGCTDVVRNALSLAMQYQCCSPQLRHACQTLMKLVANVRLEESDLVFDPSIVGFDAERNELLRILLLLETRLLWQGKTISLPPEATALEDPLARDLTLHLSVNKALVDGSGHSAYHMLVCTSQMSGKNTLMSHLLEADLAFAHILMGLPCPTLATDAYRALSENACMLCYAPAFEDLDAVWRRGAKAFSAGNLDMHASQVGDDLIRVHLLLGVAIANARRKSISHAIVKSRRALTLAQATGSRYLRDLSRIVCWAIQICAGEVVSEEELTKFEPQSNGMKALAEALALVVSGADAPSPKLKDTMLERDIVWVVTGLLTGLNRLSERLECVLPPAWLAAVQSMRAREEDEPPLLRSYPFANDPLSMPEHSVYVQLFGGFEVYVNGERLPQGAFDRRRAKSLVALACCDASRVLRRADIIDSIWPECDYDKGRKRIYAATNVINSALKGVDTECRFFDVRGNDRSLVVDGKFIRSDVEDFEDLAHRICRSEGDDDEVLALVRGAQGLYEGDLYVPPMDAEGTIERRRKELRNLYVDVLVSGAEAAFRNGSLRLAIRLCEQALLVDDAREDANACLVNSLYACGRINEAHDRTRAFNMRVGARLKDRQNPNPSG